METATSRVFTPTRIVGLALIAFVAGGLTYLRFGPEPAAVSVPAGPRHGLQSC